VAPVEEPNVVPVAEPAEESFDEPVEEPNVELFVAPVEEPNVEPGAVPVEESFDEPGEEPNVEPVAEPVVESFDEPVEEPTVEPNVEPNVESFEKPVEEPNVEPFVELVAEPNVESVEETIEEPNVEPFVELGAEPNVVSVEETSEEPNVELVEETVAEAVAEINMHHKLDSDTDNTKASIDFSNNKNITLPVIEELSNEDELEETYIPINTMVDSPISKSYIPMTPLNRYSDIFINNKSTNFSSDTDSNTDTTDSTTDDSISYCTYKNKYNSVNNIFIQKPEDNIKIMIRETAENIMKDIIQDIVDNSLDDIIDDIMNDTKETEETECLIDNIDLKYEDKTNTSTDEVLFNKNKDENDKKIEGCFKQLCRFLCNKIKNNNI